jgi:hypothetical protein
MVISKILPAIALVGGLAASASAFAQTPSQQSAVMGATTGLGSHHRFASIAMAQDHCPGDTIVWSNGVSKTYKVVQPGAAKAGRGFYACKMEADGAGFTQAD